MSVIAGVAKVSRRKGAYGDEAHEEAPPQDQEDVGGDGGGPVALVAFAALIPASQAPNAEHSLGGE